ncbi:hypothetical protein BJF79_17870 [Actinomadura sp. CNU-125]|uniref:TetR/AcrR family transcriptional regulator n=1 Tax=Actinomadura sp. CNU-125 TaxID=1904961 RepID=UPI00095B5295|nr:helix-turn-helix domain-containing protein [Actinomadura sp. CNU-125]OLT17421.1 hypothetical protein BJF79_17870 [Actinomadura sp. CNU-125]
MTERAAEGTRARILDIAGDLFRTRGYAGTSIADIAATLGTSKAALYYHFRSKEEILDALLADSLAVHARIADTAATGTATPEELLGAFIDMVAGAGRLLTIFGDDPSVLAVLEQREGDYRLRDSDDLIVTALAGTDAAAAVRARAAIAVAKDGTKGVMAAAGGRLPDRARPELLAAALRALRP